MSSARKYLALALAACRAKQYEEAGVFLAQAAQEEDVDDLVKTLGAGEDTEAQVQAEKDVEAATCSEDESEEAEDEGSEDSEEGDLDWGDEDEDGESVSSVQRRKTTSLFHIGKIIASTMSVSSDQEDEDTEEDESESEPDPDFPGQDLVPASFSSVRVKSTAETKSPVIVKHD